MSRLNHSKATRQIASYRRVGEEFKYRKKNTKKNSTPTRTNTKRLGNYWGNKQ